jgi:hypothetical protein
MNLFNYFFYCFVRPKVLFTEAVNYSTVIVCTCVQITFATGGNTVPALSLVSISCCVIGVFIKFRVWLRVMYFSL